MVAVSSSVVGSSISSIEDSVVLTVMVVVAGINSFSVVLIMVGFSLAVEVGNVSCAVVDGSPSSVVVIKGGITVSFDVVIGLAEVSSLSVTVVDVVSLVIADGSVVVSSSVVVNGSLVSNSAVVDCSVVGG